MSLNWDNIPTVTTEESSIFVTDPDAICEWKDGNCDKPAKLTVMIYNIEETGKTKVKQKLCVKHYRKIMHTCEIVSNG